MLEKNFSTVVNYITPELAHKLIQEQFPEYSHLPITSVEKQGHDNRTYRLGEKMLIRMPSAEHYSLKVAKEQELLAKLAPYLSINIPVPIKMGTPSKIYPYPFSIYKWIEGTSVNLVSLDNDSLEQLAFDLSHFLKELQAIDKVDTLKPGQHNWWRGDHISVYDKDAREQIAKLSHIIDSERSIDLWKRACKTRWNKKPVWVHGDIAIGNILVKDGKFSAVIDFSGISVGDPACDLVIAWTFFKRKAREVFIKEMNLDEDAWLRAKAWALWKATFELCEPDQASEKILANKKLIEELLS